MPLTANVRRYEAVMLTILSTAPRLLWTWTFLEVWCRSKNLLEMAHSMVRLARPDSFDGCFHPRFSHIFQIVELLCSVD